MGVGLGLGAGLGLGLGVGVACRTSPHLCFLLSPMSGTCGTSASSERLIVMSSGKIRAWWPVGAARGEG